MAACTETTDLIAAWKKNLSLRTQSLHSDQEQRDVTVFAG